MKCVALMPHVLSPDMDADVAQGHWLVRRCGAQCPSVDMDADVAQDHWLIRRCGAQCPSADMDADVAQGHWLIGRLGPNAMWWHWCWCGTRSLAYKEMWGTNPSADMMLMWHKVVWLIRRCGAQIQVTLMLMWHKIIGSWEGMILGPKCMPAQGKRSIVGHDVVS